jgi:hypothetical protein
LATSAQKEVLMITAKPSLPECSSDQALRVARLDAERAYGDLNGYRITVELESDGWHVEQLATLGESSVQFSNLTTEGKGRVRHCCQAGARPQAGEAGCRRRRLLEPGPHDNLDAGFTRRQKMRRETEDLVARLDAAEWFSSVGQPLPGAVRSVIAVSSWADAIECCGSNEWGNFVLEQQNLLTMHLHTHARDRYQDWNNIVRAIKGVTGPLVAKKLRAMDESKVIEGCVSWDILGACMEREYADIREPAFFCGLIHWYLSGRFPCGWGERDSTGKIRLLEPVDEGEYDSNEPDWTKLVLANQERLFHPKVRLPAVGKLLVF